MATHYQTYMATLNRVRLSELIDFYAMESRLQQAKPSLVVHPLTGQFYAPVDTSRRRLSLNGTHA